MSTSHESALSRFLADHAEAIAVDWRKQLQAAGGNFLRGLVPEVEQAAEMAALLKAIAMALSAEGDPLDGDGKLGLAAALRTAGELRAARGFTPAESLRYLQCGKDAMIASLQFADGDAEARQADSLRIVTLMDRCVLLDVDSFVAARDDMLMRQAESLREVSAPVITLWDSILLLPLVGVVDSVRAQNISERLLQAIGDTEAEVTLIDVTGVPVMDTAVARHILKTVAAATMLGTRVILTGISPSTAQTVVKLGIDMSGVPTRASLKSGMSLALTMTGRRIVDARPEA